MSIDLDLHGIEAQRLAVRQRHEHCEMRVGRIEQLLFQLVELRRDAQDVRFDLLYLLVQTFHLCPGAFTSAGLGRAQMHSSALITIKKCLCIRSALPSTRCRDATNNAHRCSPAEGLEFGGPAVVEPRLLRPETLRRHLSVGLPFANPKRSARVSAGRPYH